MLNILVGVMAAAFVIALVAVGSGHWQANPVLSGSMEPTLPTGGIVVTEREPVSQLRVGDIILFHRPDAPDEQVVHRITEIERDADGLTILTKGDANKAEDDWLLRPADETAWVARASIPFVGRLAVSAQSVGAAGWIAIGGAIALLAGAGLLRSNTRPEDSEAAEVPPSSVET